MGEDTALAGIQQLVAEGQASKSRAQALADRFAALPFYVAAAVGVVTYVVWSLLGDPDDAVVRTVTVLAIACPHARGLAIPLVVSLSSATAASNVLVKDRLALERMRRVDAVLLDKTGTLTAGRPSVAGVIGTEGSDEARVLRMGQSSSTSLIHPSRSVVATGPSTGSSFATAGH